MYDKNNKIIVKITNITPYGAFCRAERADGLIHISEVSDYFVKDIKDFFDIGDEIEVDVLDFNIVRKHLKLSYKNCHPELLKNDDKEIQEIKTAFQNLNKKQNKTDNIENINKINENE
ncbi:S1 RNA-binding domain-containing protein [Spiroplasma poulsonii]|uniref:General stress protein 13 n=1 Tax=Spiroplasma poulsonii TaxID=2138 RepID=A0A0C2HPN3_9MOLU|nr:S1 RNA-binding domain-containing protein [Spiroplasma poulsonii]KAF0850196.1 General stress protein 13 [Spiroplasma poulsonii]KAF0850654.1 General stress protein 13 [Spiroplasma poulsonii]KAF0850672.1 General stress protein 13 [Spiroplasma poulsonii]KAF0850914.1 General stress protein 13 [Spiroplasma poulsonii]KAF0851203.1 General stress protein 13 [Spiroplasma poulsonii]